MNSAITDKIKKLLKIAKFGTEHEADSARRLATELMERHRIVVGSDECRVSVEGVRGVYWRERVLSACARKHGCRANKKYGMVVIGDDDSRVHAAIDLYNHTCGEILRACLQTQRGVSNNYSAPIASLWCRVFLNAAANSLIARVSPIKPLRPQPYYEPWPIQYRRMQEQELRATGRTNEGEIDEENASIKAILDEINKETGASYTGAQTIRDAEWQGEYAARNLNIEYRTDRLLAAASSFLKPPPKPNRFTFLDVDFG